jgi:hypothetical protein
MMHEEDAMGSQQIAQQQARGFHLATGVFISFFGGFALLSSEPRRER